LSGEVNEPKRRREMVMAGMRHGVALFASAPETVRTHVRKAMDKLDADTRTQAVARALRDHLIS